MQSQPLDLGPRSSETAVRLARIYSDVISPTAVLSALGFAVALGALPYWRGLAWGLLHGVAVSLIPVLFILYRLRAGKIADLHIWNRRERNLPYLVATACSVVVLAIARLLGAPDLLQTLLISNVAGLALLALVNVFWQISCHAASIASAALFAHYAFGALVGVVLVPLVALTFLARLFLRRHTVAQLLAGLALGAGPVLVLASLGLIS